MGAAARPSARPTTRRSTSRPPAVGEPAGQVAEVDPHVGDRQLAPEARPEAGPLRRGRRGVAGQVRRPGRGFVAEVGHQPAPVDPYTRRRVLGQAPEHRVGGQRPPGQRVAGRADGRTEQRRRDDGGGARRRIGGPHLDGQSRLGGPDRRGEPDDAPAYDQHVHAAHRRGFRGRDRGYGGGMARSIWTGVISFGLVSVPVADVLRHPGARGLLPPVREGHQRPDPLPAGQRAHRRGGRLRRHRQGRRGRRRRVRDARPRRARRGGARPLAQPGDPHVRRPRRDRPDLLPEDVLPRRRPATRPPRRTRCCATRWPTANRAAIGTLVMRGKEYLAAIRADGDLLVLETMYFADEIRDPRKELDRLPGQGQAAAGAEDGRAAHRLDDRAVEAGGVPRHLHRPGQEAHRRRRRRARRSPWPRRRRRRPASPT